MQIEASKFTEVGYVGREVESMIRDLRRSESRWFATRSPDRTAIPQCAMRGERILDILLPDAAGVGTPGIVGTLRRRRNPDGKREKLGRWLDEGRMAEREIDIDVKRDQSLPSFENLLAAGRGGNGRQHQGMLSRTLRRQAESKKMRIGDARGSSSRKRRKRSSISRRERESGRPSRNRAASCPRRDRQDAGADSRRARTDVSREGGQRDLLPIGEGTTGNTKYGRVKTDHISSSRRASTSQTIRPHFPKCRDVPSALS